MQSVWLLLGSGPVTSARSIRLGFLGAWPFRWESPSRVLDCLGFPWILSSESRLFNGLRGLKRETFFSALVPGVRSAGTGACGRGYAEAQDYSWGKLNLASDFPQEIVVRIVSFSAASIHRQLAIGGAAKRRLAELLDGIHPKPIVDHAAARAGRSRPLQDARPLNCRSASAHFADPPIADRDPAVHSRAKVHIVGGDERRESGRSDKPGTDREVCSRS